MSVSFNAPLWCADTQTNKRQRNTRTHPLMHTKTETDTHTHEHTHTGLEAPGTSFPIPPPLLILGTLIFLSGLPNAQPLSHYSNLTRSCWQPEGLIMSLQHLSGKTHTPTNTYTSVYTDASPAVLGRRCPCTHTHTRTQTHTLFKIRSKMTSLPLLMVHPGT